MKDIFGAAFKEYLKTGIDQKIKVKNNLGSDAPLKASYFFRNYNQMPEIERYALHLTKGKVLDAGAGAGCHSIFLQSKNMEVDAIEISLGCIDIMKERGISNVFHQSIQEVQNKYDTILLLMNGIGILETIEGLKIFLKRIPEILNPGGQVLFSSTDISYMYQDDDQDSYRFDLTKPYYGELIYTLQYKKMHSEPFKWLYIDFETFENLANQFNLKTTHLFEEENGHYLARISI